MAAAAQKSADRSNEIANLVAAGLSNRQIAETVGAAKREAVHHDAAALGRYAVAIRIN